jgi:hypothetical protein
MNNKERVIIWQAYSHPYSTNSELEFPGFDGYKPPEDEPIPYEDGDVRLFDFDEMMEESQSRRGQPKRVLFTPFGVLPLSDYNDIAKLFNFWIGHTNFYLSQKILSAIATSDGVEALTPISPYRFRLAIGKAFDSIEVKTNIQNKLECKVTNVQRAKPTRY